MPASRQSIATTRLRLKRRVIAFCLVLTYLLAGTLHALYGLDVVHPSFGKPEIASLIGEADQSETSQSDPSEKGQSEKKGAAVDECHGCFSVMAPQPLLAIVSMAQVTALAWPSIADDVGITLDIDSPPPKTVT